MSKLLFFIIGLTLSNTAFAQSRDSAVIYFPNGTVHDFGIIPEGANAEHVFEFINKGNAPLMINNVASPCGCLTPSWPKDPVLPGKKGEIKLTYSTDGRLSPFNKSVYVSYNAAPGRFALTIKGRVVTDTIYAQIRKAPVFDFPYGTSHYFGRIPLESRVEHFFEVRNEGKTPLKINSVTSKDGDLTATWPKEPVMPGKKGRITLNYCASHAGLFTKYATVSTNGISWSGEKRIDLVVSGEVVDLSRDSVIIHFPGGTDYNFGKIPEGPMAECEFEFINKGYKPLLIDHVTYSCACFNADWPKQPVAPGKKGIIKVHYPTKDKPSPFAKGIYVRSNAVWSVNAEQQELTIRGVVIPADTTKRIGSWLSRADSIAFYFPTATVYDFGDLPGGPAADCVFEFINKGDKPLLITRVSSSCGCLAPYWPKEPVMPGGKGEIKAKFNTKNRQGYFQKTLTAYSSTSLQGKAEIVVLTVKGHVIPADTTKR